MTTAAKKIKTVAAVFELPKRLGIIQQVEYELPRREWCAEDGCLYEGVLSVMGCKKGICLRYYVWVSSRDRKTWEVKERWKKKRDEDMGCLRMQVADALWELSDRYDVGVWYEYVRVGMWVNQYDVFCGVVVNGIRLDQLYCRAVEECVEEMLRDYRREVERMREPPEPALVIKIDPVEELLREWPELGAFGVEWVRAWAPHARERLIEIAKVMRRYPWMVEVVRQRQVGILNPYIVEAYVAVDGSEACLSLNPPKAFCAQNGAAREARMELTFSRYEVYEDKLREVYRPKGLLAYAAAAREYVRVL